MPIQPGIYVIRRDIIGIDDVFATGVGLELPILGLRLQTNTSNVHRWEVRRQGEDTYLIVKPEFLPGPPGGFGVDDIRPEETVRFKPDPSSWIINALNEDRSIYSIQAVGGPIGATYAIDLEKRGGQEELVLKPFPVIPNAPPLPGWIFMPVLED